MHFEILGEITGVETIATGSGIREIARLRKSYGRGRWRKRKGFAEVLLNSGEILSAEVHWYEATGIGKREFKIKRFIWSVLAMAKAAKRLVICVDNSGYEVSLERRKIYVAIPDARAEKLGQLRVIDESGEDYLYPKSSFVPATLPQSVRRAVLQAA